LIGAFFGGPAARSGIAALPCYEPSRSSVERSGIDIASAAIPISLASSGLIAPPSAASAAKASAMSLKQDQFPADFLPAKSNATSWVTGRSQSSLHSGRKVRVALTKLTLSQYQ